MTDWLTPYVGKAVIADLDEFYMVLGTLQAVAADALLFTSTRVLPGSLTASGYSFAHPTIDAALQDVLASKTAA